MPKGIFAVFISAGLILAGCGGVPTPSANAVQTAIAQTAVSVPTNTPLPTAMPIPPTTMRRLTDTPTPSSKNIVDIATNVGKVLLRPGDLPYGFQLGQITEEMPEIFNSAYLSSIATPVTINLGGDMEREGKIAVLFFETESDARKGFEYISHGSDLATTIRGDIGERSLFKGTRDMSYFMGGLSGSPPGPSNGSASVTFLRCNVIVYAYLKGKGAEPETNSVTNYSKSLDFRITPIVCVK